MSLKLRKGSLEIEKALVDQLNQLRDASVGSNFHASATALTGGVPPVATTLAVAVANASDLATSLVLVNDIKRVMNVHFADTLAHKTAVSAAVATAEATDLATGITLANALKSAFGTHLAAANVHFTNDATNTIAAANASDQGTLNTLLNEMKGDLNAHIAGALAGQHIELVGP